MKIGAFFFATGSFTGVALLVAGCGGAVVTGDDAGVGTDAAPHDGSTATDASLPPFDAGAFCTGTKPRLMVNGAEVPVLSATGKAFALNCCDSAELLVASAAYQAILAVLWRAPAPMGSSIDLGSPPNGFGIELDLGCDPATTSCASASPEERYASGFHGTLQYAPSGAGLTASYCLSVAESPSAPHVLIHSLVLYAPNVASAY